MSIKRSFLEGLEPALATAVAIVIIFGGLYYHNPKIFTHPSHFMPDVPNELIINEVKPMLGCNERIKKYIMSAGEVKEQDLNPNVSIMFCGG